MERRKRRNLITDDPDALDLRAIAKRMGELGYPMGHNSARGYLLRAMKKLAKAVTEHYGVKRTEAELELMAKQPDFQFAMRDIVCDVMVGKQGHS